MRAQSSQLNRLSGLIFGRFPLSFFGSCDQDWLVDDMFRNRSQGSFPLLASCDHQTRPPLSDCQSAFPQEASHPSHSCLEHLSFSTPSLITRHFGIMIIYDISCPVKYEMSYNRCFAMYKWHRFKLYVCHTKGADLMQ